MPFGEHRIEVARVPATLASIDSGGGNPYVGLGSLLWASMYFRMSAVGKILAQFVLEHTTDGIATPVGKLAEFGDPTDIHRSGSVRPNGRLIGVLLGTGPSVIPVSPKMNNYPVAP